MMIFGKKLFFLWTIVSLVAILFVSYDPVSAVSTSNYMSPDIILTNSLSLMGSVEPCASDFLGFPVWYRGLTDENNDCNIKSPSDGLQEFIWTIALNVIGAAMMLAAYVSVGFIIMGGVKFMTSAGSSDGIAKAKSTITNAVIGLVISILAIAIVNFIFSNLQRGV
jgi:hypothetical protein